MSTATTDELDQGVEEPTVESPEADAIEEALLPDVREGDPTSVLRFVEPALPVTPEVSELTRMAQLATTFAAASLVPDYLRGRPADVLLIMMEARALGIHYTTAFRELYVIGGKVAMHEKMKLGLIRQSGLGRIWPDPDNDEHSATWHARRADDPDVLYSATFTMEDAARVEAKEHGKTMPMSQTTTYRQYPKDMLSWRACGRAMRMAYSEVGTGLYSPDELGAITDPEGNFIDISEVEPLVQSDKDRAKAERAAEGEAIAPKEDRDALFAQIKSLPEDIQEELRARWKEAELPPVMNLPVAKMRKSKALVSGFVAKARSQGWEPPEQPSEGAEGDAGTATTPEGAPAQQADAQPPETDDQERAEDPEPGLDPSGEAWPEYPEDRVEQCRIVSEQLRPVMIGATTKLVEDTATAVKGMQWRGVNSELAHVHAVPHEVIEALHIDARRMLLVGYRVAARPM